MRRLASALFAGALAASVSARAATPDTLGPAMPAAEAKGAMTARMTLLPDHGPAGTKVNAVIDWLPSGQSFDLVWRTVDGSWKVADSEYRGRAYAPAGYRITAVKSNAAGHVEASFAAPDDFGFSHDVQLQQQTRLFAQAGFAIDMTMQVSPDRVPPGGDIAIDISGIGWRQLENSWLLRYDNNFTGWVSAVTTRGAAHFSIPATGGPGTHVIELMHGEFTFPYLNPQQNPEPDRPRFAFNVAVTPQPVVLPPEPEAQVQTQVRHLPAAGNLVATPPFAGVGQNVVVRGSGLAPGASYALEWGTLTGNRVGDSTTETHLDRLTGTTLTGNLVGNGTWEERARRVAEARADTKGDVSFRFAVPDDLGGAHRIAVSGDKAGLFWVTTKVLPLDVARGPAGTGFEIHLKGVGWTETANIYTVVYDNNYIGYACGFNSQGDVAIFLKATGAPGWHFIDLYPAIYKGQEARPNNFRIPQLTYEADHPGEDLPHFRFAFEVTPDRPAEKASLDVAR